MITKEDINKNLYAEEYKKVCDIVNIAQIFELS